MAGGKSSINNSYSTQQIRNGDARNKNAPQSKFSEITASAVVFCVAVLCFANSYDGEFVFDDAEAVESNKDLLPSTPIEQLLHHDFWGRKLSNLSHKSYRPLTVLTFRWNYLAAGGLHPKGFHIVNLILHGAICVVLLPFFSLVLSGPAGSGGSSRNGAPLWSFLCSILFAVHPVHTESVAGIVGRADLLCALFFILSFLLYVRGSTIHSQFRPTSFSLVWLALSFVCCGLATFSKEQGITVIGVCSAYDILSTCGLDLGALFGLCRSETTSSPQSTSTHSTLSNDVPSGKGRGRLPQWQVSLIKRHLLLAATAVFLLVVRWRVMGSAPPTFQIHDNPHSFVNGSVFRIINYNYLYAINIWILLLPQWLCFDWSMGCVPTITSLHDPRLIAVALFWLASALLCRACLCCGTAEARRTLTLCVALIVVPFLPATNILFRVGFVVAERVLYLPSTGFCLLVVVGLRKICGYYKLKGVAVTGFVLLIIVFAARSMQRSNEWRHGIWLFRAGEKICPLNAKVHYNIGKLCSDRGNITEAVDRYRLAIELNPVYDQAMNNLANILKDQDNVLEAEMLLDRAVSISPDFAAAWMNRGIIKSALKKFQEAEDSYKQGIRCRRNYPDCYYNLGNLYIEMGRSQDALDAFKNATILKPTHWNSWNNAIAVLDNLKLYDQATKLALTALKILPDNPSIVYSMASSLGKQDKFEESEKWFLASIQINPNNANFHLNLGVLYHRWGKYKEAAASYERSLQLDPTNAVTVENNRLLQAQWKKPS